MHRDILGIGEIQNLHQKIRHSMGHEDMPAKLWYGHFRRINPKSVSMHHMKEVRSLYGIHIPPISILKWCLILSELKQTKVLLQTLDFSLNYFNLFVGLLRWHAGPSLKTKVICENIMVTKPRNRLNLHFLITSFRLLFFFKKLFEFEGSITNAC